MQRPSRYHERTIMGSRAAFLVKAVFLLRQGVDTALSSASPSLSSAGLLQPESKRRKAPSSTSEFAAFLWQFHAATVGTATAQNPSGNTTNTDALWALWLCTAFQAEIREDRAQISAPFPLASVLGPQMVWGHGAPAVSATPGNPGRGETRRALFRLLGPDALEAAERFCSSSGAKNIIEEFARETMRRFDTPALMRQLVHMKDAEGSPEYHYTEYDRLANEVKQAASWEDVPAGRRVPWFHLQMPGPAGGSPLGDAWISFPHWPLPEEVLTSSVQGIQVSVSPAPNTRFFHSAGGWLKLKWKVPVAALLVPHSLGAAGSSGSLGTDVEFSILFDVAPRPESEQQQGARSPRPVLYLLQCDWGRSAEDQAQDQRQHNFWPPRPESDGTYGSFSVGLSANYPVPHPPAG